MWTLAAVTLGGAVGSAARYGVSLWMVAWLGAPNAWGTFAVNVLGSFLLGLILGAAELRSLTLSPAWREGLTAGVLGGFTTFSTLMFQAVRQAEAGSPASAALNLGGSVAIGLAVTVLGLFAGRHL